MYFFKDFSGGSRSIRVKNMRNPSNFYVINLLLAARTRKVVFVFVKIILFPIPLFIPLFLINQQREGQGMKAEGGSISVENPVDDCSINLYSKGPPREVNLGLNFGDCYVGLEKVFCFITLLANMYSRHCFVL